MSVLGSLTLGGKATCCLILGAGEGPKRGPEGRDSGMFILGGGVILEVPVVVALSLLLLRKEVGLVIAGLTRGVKGLEPCFLMGGEVLLEVGPGLVGFVFGLP